MNARSNATLRRVESSSEEVTRSNAPAAHPGTFGVRFVAFFVDGLILGTIQMPFSFLFGYLGGMTVGTRMYWVVFAGSYAVGIGATVLYYGWFYRNKGATPGKMLFKLKVIDAKTGTHLSYGRVFMREVLGKFLSAILLMAGYLMVAFREDRRALHDLLGGSQVIRRG
jgi:uncharacterized RDD family membrane protein YckC